MANRISEETLDKIIREWELDTLEVTPDPFISKLKIGEPELLLLLENLKFKTYLRFDLLLDLTAVDCGSHFTLVYLLYSTHLGHRVMVKCDIPREKSRILSVCKLYPAAEVLEREVYDLMGIKFVGHPNLKRIILADDFVGHPLRKDYRPAEQEVSNG